ncbi:MAG: pilus assembly protein PilB, partial [Geobacter sp.]|nr:pilus assembly protein PilB [Geobacter sp.]
MITKRLGELLIEQGLISQEQLDEALDMQKMFPDQTVGQLLCRLGYIRESDLSLVLDQKNKRRKLADIMLKEGLLDQQKLSQARELSRQNDIPLERALLKLRF